MTFPKLKSWQWILIVLAFLVALDWAIRRPDSRSRELSEVIQTQGSAELKKYPYPFHVMRVQGSTAVMGTPRSAESPAFRFLGVIYPEINVKDANNPAFIAIEKELAKVQDEARTIVLAQTGIKDVSWELDREWLRRNHVPLPDK